MVDRIVNAGVDHNSAPIELRDQMAFSESRLLDAIQHLTKKPGVLEALILSTCNRSELYAVIELETAGTELLADFLAEYHQCPPERLAPHLIFRQGRKAVEHLFRVAAGLEALVMGETQITAQVKNALDTARRAGAVGEILGRVCESALAASKTVRAETHLGEGPNSISAAAVDLAQKIFGELSASRVLVVGAGNTGQLTLGHLLEYRPASLSIINRTHAVALELAAEHDCRAAPWEQLESELASADIIICATGAPQAIITREMVGRVMHQRANRPLFLVDIAVPRDVEPSVGVLDNVFVFNIDDLQAVVSESRARRQAEVPKAEALIAPAVEQVEAWIDTLVVKDVLVGLRRYVETWSQTEFKRLESRLTGISVQHHQELEEFVHRLINKLLHTPTSRIKSPQAHIRRTQLADSLNFLFDLRHDSSAQTIEDESNTKGDASGEPILPFQGLGNSSSNPNGAQ